MDIDWQSLFSFDVPVLEIFIRGSAMYLALIFLMRVILKRQSGGLESGDILLLLLLADASSNGMAGDYKSIPDGIVLVATLMFWNYFLDWLSFRFPKFERLMEARPVVLIKNGKMVAKNMRKEYVTRAELLSQLREQGIDKLHQVKRAYIESDGKLSVIEMDHTTDQHSEPQDKQT